MRDPKSENTVKNVMDDIEKMFMEIAQKVVGKYSSPVMIDSHLPKDDKERNTVINSILKELKKRIQTYKNKKISDEGQERKRQLAIDAISKKVERVIGMAKKNDSRTIYQLPTMVFIEKVPFDEIVVSSIIKEKLGY